MAGWIIDVRVLSLEEAQLKENFNRAVLAKWDASPLGIAGFEKMVEYGRAKKVRFDGYPVRYISTAKYIIPHITTGYVSPQNESLFTPLDDPNFEGHYYGELKIFDIRKVKCNPPALWGDVVVDLELFDKCTSNPEIAVVIDAWDIT
jgi:hypothetical protein